MIAGYEEMARVAGVGGDTFISRMVEVALIEPEMVAVVETDERAPAGELEAAKADVLCP